MMMIEKMAKAIAKAAVAQNPTLQYFEDNGIGYFDDYDNQNYDCMAMARAAIEAMREPTDEMKNCSDEVHWGYSCHTCGGLQEGWEAMIDAALKEEQ